jgi:hypothetical protein
LYLAVNAAKTDKMLVVVELLKAGADIAAAYLLERPQIRQLLMSNLQQVSKLRTLELILVAAVLGDNLTVQLLLYSCERCHRWI